MDDDEASVLSDSTNNSSILSSLDSSANSTSSVDSSRFSEVSSSSQSDTISPIRDSNYSTSSTVVEDDYHLPIYDGARITYYESHMQLFQYALRHRLTKAAFSDLLSVIENHLPPKPTLSLYKLKKYFLHLYEDIELTTHYCCTTCQSPLPARNSVCPNDCKQSAEEFISIAIQKQLTLRLKDPVFWKKLQKRFERSAEPGVLRDVLDGKEYLKHREFVSNPGNVTFIINTDGVKMFHSSAVSLWPIWLAINELPPNIRFHRDNLLLAGLWFGKVKPIMTTYMKPLMDELKVLSSTGVSVNSPIGEIIAKARLLQCSVDLPARAVVLNMKQFNGKHACLYCEDEGTPRASSHMHRNWLPSNTSVTRTHHSIISNAKDALQTSQPVVGIKGASALCSQKSFNLCTGVVIDVMHCVYLGVMAKTLMGLWFGVGNAGKQFSIRRKLNQCEERMKTVQVPLEFSRTPRPLSDVKHWKASEYRSWLLYFSLPVLHGILPDPFFAHYALLVASMHLLLSDRITESSLLSAKAYLCRFYEKFPILYGENACTMNVHMLTHLVDCVENWGPLWAYSCFHFESGNGQIKSHFHGTRAMNVQLALSYIMQQLMPPSALHNSHSHTQNIKLHDCTAVGTLTPINISQDVKDVIWRKWRESAPTGSQFFRAIVNDNMFYSKYYHRMKTRNNYTIYYEDEGRKKYGQILYFLSTTWNSLAVVSPFEPTTSICYPQQLGILRSRIIPVKIERVLTVVPVQSLICKCVCISRGATVVYVVKPPNNMPGD